MEKEIKFLIYRSADENVSVNATVVYEGTIIPHQTGTYMFNHYYSGYQRIFIDGQDIYTEDVAGTGSDQHTRLYGHGISQTSLRTYRPWLVR